jgi:uncharacterized protein (UPF0210 family)
MEPQLRAITLGLPLDPENPDRAIARARTVFAAARELLARHDLSVRCFRLTCQPVDVLYPDAARRRRNAAALAQHVEALLGEEAWFCLPGPFYTRPDADPRDLDLIPEILDTTRNVFTNTLVSSHAGMHRGAVQHAGRIVYELARLQPNRLANFRFAVMANIEANAPFFPASFHHGKAGFSLALELAAVASRCVREEGGVNDKLRQLHRAIRQLLEPVMTMAEQLTRAEELEFKGIDFSLAPFPGERTSAVRSLEQLNNAAIGQYEFMFSLYAMNNLLKRGFQQYPQVGFNGTMLSVLEDSWLAKRVNSGAVSTKDLLLYATVCGCGLDMAPLALETPPAHLAALIQAVAVTALKWNKPLIARLAPMEERSSWASVIPHEFIVPAKPLPLAPEHFSSMADAGSFFAPIELD